MVLFKGKYFFLGEQFFSSDESFCFLESFGQVSDRLVTVTIGNELCLLYNYVSVVDAAAGPRP
jgi:hypothetical protein